MEKQKLVERSRNGDSERSGMRNDGIQSEECQEFRSDKATSSLIPEMRCENPKLDLTNKVMGNHCLSDVDNRSTHYCDQPDRIFDMHVRLDI